MSSSGIGAGCWATRRPAEATRVRARLPGGERRLSAVARLRLLPGPEPAVGADPAKVRGAVWPGLSDPGAAALPQGPGQRPVHGGAVHHLPRARHRKDRSAAGCPTTRSQPSGDDQRRGLREVRPGDTDLPAGHGGRQSLGEPLGRRVAIGLAIGEGLPVRRRLAVGHRLAGRHPLAANGKVVNDPSTNKPVVAQLTGFIPNAYKGLGIDESGCIICHNGNRQATTQDGAHQNLVPNPFGVYDTAPGVFENTCATCHGATGEGGKGPPLNDQNRLGFFNDDYYYRCIYLGNTGEEHKGTIMPAWGVSQQGRPPILARDTINLLVHWVRMWQQYTSQP